MVHLRREWPSALLFATGFSLGANILVKYLGEQVRPTQSTWPNILVEVPQQSYHGTRS